MALLLWLGPCAPVVIALHASSCVNLCHSVRHCAALTGTSASSVTVTLAAELNNPLDFPFNLGVAHLFVIALFTVEAACILLVARACVIAGCARA
jgi:hypothetical protein